MVRRAPLLAVISLLVLCAYAQESLTIEKIFSGAFDTESGAMAGQWLPNGTSMLGVERGQVTSTDIRSGKTSVLVRASQLRGFVSESATLSGSKILLFGNSRKVWRLNTRGDYAVFDFKSHRLVRLGPAKARSELMFAKLAPKADKVGYVYRNNLYSYNFSTGRTTQLTSDGAGDVTNGTFDWVYEEELGLRDGWRWSPDGTSIAFWQVDARPEPKFTLVDQSKWTQVLKQYAYPKAGDPNAKARIGVVSSEGGPVRWMKPAATSWNGYLARMDWVPGSKNLLIQFLNRRQNRIDFYVVDSRTGKEKLVWTDSDPAWVDVCDTGPNGVEWTNGGRRFLAFSERSGRRHLYSVGLDGTSLDLTPGILDVDPIGIQVRGTAAYFYASPGDATQRYLYRSSLKSPKPVRLTPDTFAGTNDYSLAPTGGLAIHEFSKLGEPPTTELIELSNHRIVRALSPNATLRRKLAAISKGRIERRTFAAADGRSSMDGIVVYPPDFDPTKRYPVLFEVYGGPAAALVHDQWLGLRQIFWWFLAQQGYIVATVDNRGTPAPKDRAWRKSIYLHMNPVIAADQAAAGRQMAALPFVDPQAIAIWGWSSGGTNTLQAMFAYSDVWSLGMAVAPGTNIALYDTIYTERYSGLPTEHPKAYFDDSPTNFARGLKGDLLLVFGTGDDNCHSQNSEWLIDRLVAEGKKFTVMTYPNRSHDLNEGKGTIEHVFNTLVDFLKSRIRSGPRP
jgi:dipeptidyl-peptidase 4